MGFIHTFFFFFFSLFVFNFSNFFVLPTRFLLPVFGAFVSLRWSCSLFYKTLILVTTLNCFVKYLATLLSPIYTQFIIIIIIMIIFFFLIIFLLVSFLLEF